VLRVASAEANVGIRGQDEMESLITYLTGKGYKGVVRNMLNAALRLVEPSRADEQLVTTMITGGRYRTRLRGTQQEVFGELFVSDYALLVLIPLDREKLRAYAIGFENQEQLLQQFCHHVEEGIRQKFDGRRVRGMEFDWKSLGVRVVTYGRYRYAPEGEVSPDETGTTILQGQDPQYTLEEATAAKLLVDTNARQFVLRLAQLGKITSKDAVDLAKGSEIPQLLLAAGLVGEEYLLTCKQDQHTICLVPSKDCLGQEPMASLRCSVCSRTFPQENLQVIYTLTTRGKALIEGSRWMYIWVTEILKGSGVREKAIKWTGESSGEDIDIMVEDLESRTFFELKDREFGLGDAYPFAYRITRYGGILGVVVTMDKVSTDAKRFFAEETQRREFPVRIQYLEGAENIEKGISDIITDLAVVQIRRVVWALSSDIGIDLWPLVSRWLDARKSQVGTQV